MELMVPFNLSAVLARPPQSPGVSRFLSPFVFGTGHDKQAFAMLELLKQNRVDAVICTQSWLRCPTLDFS